MSLTVLLFIPSRDWGTVENVVPGNSSSKPDQLDSKGKGAEISLNDILIFYLLIYFLIYFFIYSKS